MSRPTPKFWVGSTTSTVDPPTQNGWALAPDAFWVGSTTSTVDEPTQNGPGTGDHPR